MARDSVQSLQLVVHLHFQTFFAHLHARIKEPRRATQLAGVSDVHLALADATALGARRMWLAIHVEAKAAAGVHGILVAGLQLSLYVLRLSPLVRVACAPAVAAAETPVLHEFVWVSCRDIPVSLQDHVLRDLGALLQRLLAFRKISLNLRVS